MPVYEYTALDSTGKRLHGIVDADSPRVARQKLRKSGVFPVKIDKTAAPRETPAGASTWIRLRTRIASGELSVMTRQLATLLAAGIHLVGALDAVISQLGNSRLERIMAQVNDAVKEGNSLAQALSQHPGVFSPVYVNMVQAGEASGSLDVVLERLADFSEHAEALKGRLRAALAYPIFMLITGFLILLFLLTYIIPDIAGIFSEMDRVLPLATRILMAAGGFLRNFWWVLLLALLAGALAWRHVGKSSAGRYLLDRLKLRLPIIGSLNRNLAVARFGRALGGLLQGGVSLIQALSIVRNAVNNVLFCESIDAAIVEIEAGRSLASNLSANPWFSPIAVQMISVGEQSGNLDRMLNKMADITEREVESRITALMSLLEPAMILVMGIVVGFIVVSILLPLFEMNQLVR